MKNKLTMLLLIAALSLAFYACSDDNTSNPPDDNENASEYYMVQVGNWWYYQNENTDTNDAVIPETTTYDTTMVVGELDYKGKRAYKVISHVQDGEDSYLDTSYVAVEGSQLYTYMDNMGNDQLLVPFGGWILIADFNQNEWTVLDSTVEDVDVPLTDSLTGKLNATIKITGKKLDKENITIKGETVEAQKFLQNVSIVGTLDMGGGLKINLNNDIQITNYYGKNVGMAKSIQPASKISIPFFGNMQVEGTRSMLLDYHVK